MSKAMAGLAAGGAVAGFAALAAGIGASVKAAASFEQSLNNVQAATGATAESMAAMRVEALAIGRDTSKSASDAVAAMGELTKSGVSVQDAVGGVARTVVQLSEATGSSVSNMATLLSDTLNVFQVGAGGAAAAADTLTKAAGASSISIDDMALSLSAGGLVAKNAGLDVTEFATAIGIMGNQGLKASDAGTSLKAMIAGLTPSTKEAKAAFQELGIQVFDAEGKFRAFPEILGSLEQAFSGLTEEQRAQKAELIFGSDGIRAFSALIPPLNAGLGGATEQWNKFGTAMQSAPSLAEQAAQRLKGFQGQIEILKGTLETIAIEIGSAFLPALTKMTATLGAELPGAFEKAKSSIEDLRAAFDDLAGGDLGEGLTGLGTKLKEAFADLGPSVTEGLSEIRTAFNEAFSGVLDEIGPTIDAIIDHVTRIVDAIRENWDQIQPIVEPIWDAIVDLVQLALDNISNAIQLVMNIIQGDWQGAWDNIKTITSNDWDAIGVIVQLGADAIPAILELSWSAFDAIVTGRVGWTTDGDSSGARRHPRTD